MTSQRWPTLSRLSIRTTIVIAAVIAISVFATGEAVLYAQNCDAECEYIYCWQDGYPSPPCGSCGEYTEWVEIYRAGPHCTACGAGWCKATVKADPDHCEVCQQQFIEQCLTCIIG